MWHLVVPLVVSLGFLVVTMIQYPGGWWVLLIPAGVYAAVWALKL